MKNILTILKKEFRRFFFDKRLVLTTLILPGLLIFVLYSFIGTGISDKVSVDDKYSYSVYAVNMPQSVQSALDSMELKYEQKPVSDVDEVKNMVKNKKADILLIFPENFDEKIGEFLSGGAYEPMNVQVYYNSSRMQSENIYSIVCGLLDSYEESVANVFDINKEVTGDLATDDDIAKMVLSMVLPFLLMMLIFSGCMGIVPESIAGEKERGTIATLLVTPIKRSELALGKVLALSVISMLCALSSFIGTAASLPKIMGGVNIGANVFGAEIYFGIFFSVIILVPVIVSIISVISAFAKSVKEASMMAMPVMIIMIVLGITSMLSQSSPAAALYCIPIYNSLLTVSEMLLTGFNALHFVMMAATDIAFSALMIFLMTKMFNSEKLMFRK